MRLRQFIPLVAVLFVCSIAEADKRPNVLLLVSDDLRTSLGTYGEPVYTPNLDRLAERGIQFDRAYCQFPLCGPSRASFMTGLRPYTVGVLANNLTVRHHKPDVITMPQLFREHGYFSARVGKIYHLGIPGNVGEAGPDDPESWDHTYNPPGAEFTTPGEEHDPDPKRGQSFRRVLGEGEGVEQADYQAADEAIRLLNEKREQPLFLAVGFIRPHVPVIAPRKYFDLYDVSKIQRPYVPDNYRENKPPLAFFHKEIDYGMSEEDCIESIRAYYATVSFLDAQVGRILDELDRLNLTDNTIIVFVSDHGYLLGQHRAWQKMSLFEDSPRVPMIMAGPRVKHPGTPTRALVEMIDIFPTVAELCDIKVPDEVEGVSLVPLLEDPSRTVKDAAYTQVNRPGRIGHSVRTERWRFNEWNGGRGGYELYDHDNDPNEYNNLANDPAHADVVAEMRALLHKVLPPPAQE